MVENDKPSFLLMLLANSGWHGALQHNMLCMIFMIMKMSCYPMITKLFFRDLELTDWKNIVATMAILDFRTLSMTELPALLKIFSLYKNPLTLPECPQLKKMSFLPQNVFTS